MDTIKILLGKYKKLGGTNEENFIDVPLDAYEKNLPVGDAGVELNVYERYFYEKDTSDKYRLAFTVSPVCTNVLFNIITEPVYKEGSDDCVVFGPTKLGNSDWNKLEQPFINYLEYKGLVGETAKSTVTRRFLIRDTGFSHPSVGPVVYHCGYDIFNNHTLRRKNFFVVNRMPDANSDQNHASRPNFNTLSDSLRDRYGERVAQKIPKIQGNHLTNTKTYLHLNQYEDVYSYVDSVEHNLVERNGWIGFLNTTYLPVVNYVTKDGEEVVLNKCMNNNKAWEQIDMYPDRTLYWFTPKFNKYRGRYERNWDYKITYPASSSKEFPFVKNPDAGVNGLSCKIVTTIDQNAMAENEAMLITFRSYVRCNLKEGDMVTISVIGENGTIKKSRPVRVVANGEDEERDFSLRLYDIVNEIGTVTSGKLVLRDIKDIRVCRNVAGRDCEYYVRYFKPINDSGYRNSINKLAFAQTIYADPVAQILFNDDISVGDLRDNLGRPITELYLTIVKTNKGHKKWYANNPKYADEDIEFSHCFGEVTSGFDFPVDEEATEFNIHRIHSVPDTYCMTSGRVTKSPMKLENDITMLDTEFAGDIVEFSPYDVQETVLEDVYHRFNTAQRETVNDMYSGFTYEEITYDDYDVKSRASYTVDANRRVSRKEINIIPEGYYYKPHYRIQIREFDTTVQQGYHKKINFTPIGPSTEKAQWVVETDRNYYFRARRETFEGTVSGDTVYVYRGDKLYTGEVTEVATEGEKAYRLITIVFYKPETRDGFAYQPERVNLTGANVRMFRHNTEMPDVAYDLKDGSGRYLWRELLSSAEVPSTSDIYNSYFTNGATYFHKNIAFYLKRQDPEGVYGIGNEPEDLIDMFIISNKAKDVSIADYVEEEGGNTIC